MTTEQKHPLINEIDQHTIWCPISQKREDLDLRYICIWHRLEHKTAVMYGLCPDCADAMEVFKEKNVSLFPQIEKALVERSGA